MEKTVDHNSTYQKIVQTPKQNDDPDNVQAPKREVENTNRVGQ